MRPVPLAHVFVLLTLVAAASPQPTHAAKLLIVPLASESHIAAFTALSTALEAHGSNDVHMVVSEGLLGASQAMAAARNATHSHTYLTYPLRYELFPQDMADMAKANSIRAMAIGFKVLAAMTDMVIGNQQLLQEIKALQPDLIIGDATASYGFWLSGLTGIPSIEFDVGTSSGLLHSMHGGQFNPAYVPAPGTFYPSTGMTLPQRCINTAATLAVRGMALLHGDYGPIRALADKHGLKHLPGRGPHKPLLLLVNFDWALEPPRPISPAIKYLGALMPTAPQPLPQDISSWLDGVDEGNKTPLPVVLLSFGASFAAPEAAVPAVAAAVAGASQHMRVIISMKAAEQQLLKDAWQKLGHRVSEGAVLLRERVPQNDLLGSGRLAAFVTQGGYLSMQEAAYHAVPVITIPLSLGQEEISQYAADQGRGLLVRKETLLAGHHQPLLDALMQVVVANNGAFQAQADVVAARLRAHPNPGKQAAEWVAYALGVARAHTLAKHVVGTTGSFLHTQGQDMPWWQVQLLDVAAVYAAVVLAVCLVLRGLYRLLRSPPATPPHGSIGKQLKNA